MSRTHTHDDYKIFADVAEVPASGPLRKALYATTKAPDGVHLAFDRRAIPLLQGIAADESLARECNNIIAILQSNGMVVVCPRPD